MCGIAGIVRFAGLRPTEHHLGSTMAACLRHRGPDEAGAWNDHFASLGHARLSIIDLAGGRQPLANEDGTIQVVFNGEIYNYRTLADQMRACGHTLRTSSDTEVLVHLYEEFGESFVEHLNGMFAIALWDARQHKLIMVRDRLGIKPLYWHHDGQRVVFGSELKALLAAGDVPRRLAGPALVDYLTFGHVPAPGTVFEDIRKLEPGFLAVCTQSRVALRRWWDIPFDTDLDRGAMPPSAVGTHDHSAPAPKAKPWVDRFAELFEDAVRLRLIADVPVGSFLSGGVDSAAVASAMHRQASGRILTHTVGFDDRDYDERTRAQTVAHRLDTDHHEVMVHPDAAWAAETLVRHFDEPFADSSAVPTFYLSQVARERVKVALSGDGGDEMLAGYRRYRFDLAESAIRDRCPSWLRRPTAGIAGWLYPKGDWLPRPLRAKRTLQNLACDDATAHLRSVSILAGTLPRLLLRPEVLAQAGGHDPFTRGRDLFRRCGSRDRLNRLLYVDMKTLLADDILTKVDRASMAVGLEVRVPLLDYRLVALTSQMPVALKLAGRQGKVVLRQMVARWLGPDVAGRPKKGFDVPVDAWFRGPLRDLACDTLTGSGSISHQWIEPRAVRRLLADHDRGLRANGHILWTLLNFELWARAYARDLSAPVSRTVSRSPARNDSFDVAVAGVTA